MNEIVTAVSTVGFPIVMCLMLLYYNRESQKLHKEEMTNLTQVLQDNNIILAKLKELLEIKIGGIEDGSQSKWRFNCSN